MSDERFTRREFLLLSAVFGATVAAGRVWHEPAGSAPATDAGLLVSLVRPLASARVIGAAYLAATPSEADPVRLADAILAGLEGGPRTPAATRRRLARRIERDFGANETVTLDGWIVSRTEARLCALAHLAVS
jgi:hypothetical protein